MIHPRTRLQRFPPALGPVPFLALGTAGVRAATSGWQNFLSQLPLEGAKYPETNHDVRRLNQIRSADGDRDGSGSSLCDLLRSSSARDRVRTGDAEHQVGGASQGRSGTGAYAAASGLTRALERFRDSRHRKRHLSISTDRTTLRANTAFAGAPGCGLLARQVKSGGAKHDIRCACDIDRHRRRESQIFWRKPPQVEAPVHP